MHRCVGGTTEGELLVRAQHDYILLRAYDRSVILQYRECIGGRRAGGTNPGPITYACRGSRADKKKAPAVR